MFGILATIRIKPDQRGQFLVTIRETALSSIVPTGANGRSSRHERIWPGQIARSRLRTLAPPLVAPRGLADDPGMSQEIVTSICYLPGNPSSRKIKADRAETGSQAQLQSPIGAPLPSNILPDRMPF